MGGDESDFNVSLIVKGKVTKAVRKPQLLRRDQIESNQDRFVDQPNALPLSQTGSLIRQQY